MVVVGWRDQKREVKGTDWKEGYKQGKMNSSSSGGDDIRCGESILDEREES